MGGLVRKRRTCDEEKRGRKKIGRIRYGGDGDVQRFRKLNRGV